MIRNNSVSALHVGAARRPTSITCYLSAATFPGEDPNNNQPGNNQQIDAAALMDRHITPAVTHRSMWQQGEHLADRQRSEVSSWGASTTPECFPLNWIHCRTPRPVQSSWTLTGMLTGMLTGLTPSQGLKLEPVSAEMFSLVSVFLWFMTSALLLIHVYCQWPADPGRLIGWPSGPDPSWCQWTHHGSEKAFCSQNSAVKHCCSFLSLIHFNSVCWKLL